MIKKYIFLAAILLVAQGTVFTMMHTKKMYGIKRLPLNKDNSRIYCESTLFLNDPLNKMSSAERSALEKELKERDKHYAWQIANEVAKIRVKFEILAAKLPPHQEKRMLCEANNIVISKWE